MAARVVGIRQEGVNPCRMVPSMWDEVHGSYMTSRARSSMRGGEFPRRSARCELPRWLRDLNLNNELIWRTKKNKPRFRVNRIPRSGVKTPCPGHRITTS